MELDKIKKFLELARKENVAELDYQGNDIKIRVSFKQRSSEIYLPNQSAPQLFVDAPKNPTKAVVPTPSEDKNFHFVKAPFVGTFYISTAPGEPAYVKVGDRVNKGQTLCILEAMKIMNEIESDQNGEIVEICVENENYVEFGQVLFKIRP
jgi:acetyl-CoA carboxylase biotin carboxyl carrier protein